MTRRTPLTVLRGGVADHPAVRAWSRVRAGHAEPEVVEVWNESPKRHPACIYRLLLGQQVEGAVYAKWCPLSDMVVERTIYETILPRLPIRSPIYYGSVDDVDGTAWIFLEDVGSQRLSPQDPEHRVAAARWLATLHRHGARLELAAGLPSAGPSRYLRLLELARGRVQGNLGNPALRQEDREMLGRVLVLLKHVADRWGEFEALCGELPATLVHGDFRSKNVRIREEETGPALYALDWETAGWGPAVRDLAPARGPEMAMQIDIEVYRSELGPEWPRLDTATIRRLSLLGHLFHGLAAIEWETLDLHHQDPTWLIRSLTSLEVLTQSTWRGLESAAEALP